MFRLFDSDYSGEWKEGKRFGQGTSFFLLIFIKAHKLMIRGISTKDIG